MSADALTSAKIGPLVPFLEAFAEADAKQLEKNGNEQNGAGGRAR